MEESKLCPKCNQREAQYFTECNHSYCIECLCHMEYCYICKNPLQREELCKEVRQIFWKKMGNIKSWEKIQHFSPRERMRHFMRILGGMGGEWHYSN